MPRPEAPISYLDALQLLDKVARQPERPHQKKFPSRTHLGLVTHPAEAKVPAAPPVPLEIMSGKLVTGESLAIHEFHLGPGQIAHAPHQHPHVEFIMVREGTIDSTCSGSIHILTPGIIGYIPLDQLHFFCNTGTVPATCFVLALGK